jgi:hypothetical protein
MTTSWSSAPTRRRASRPGSAAIGRSLRPRATRCSSSTSTSVVGRSSISPPGTSTGPKLFGRSEPRTGIEPFGRLVEQVMTSEPCRSARRVFWVLDNGSPSRPGVRRPPHRGISAVGPRPSPGPRQLAQPGRDLLHTPERHGDFQSGRGRELGGRAADPCRRRARPFLWVDQLRELVDHAKEDRLREARHKPEDAV